MGTSGTSTPFPDLHEILHATARYLGALTVLDESALAAPSALPGWTRAHVVAHLSRNADAFTRVLARAAAGEPASMYDSPESRDDDIATTVCAHDARGLVEDAQASSRRLEDAAASYDGPPDATYTRLPGEEAALPVGTVVPRRRIELEVHHADLLLDYRPAEWPEDFSRDLVGHRMDELGLDGPSMVLSSTDVDGLWKLGSGPGPQITGTVGDLAWWLVGRGGGTGLVSSTGELPQIAKWR
jgi:maleylpyruvate isomerase